MPREQPIQVGTREASRGSCFYSETGRLSDAFFLTRRKLKQPRKEYAVELVICSHRAKQITANN